MEGARRAADDRAHRASALDLLLRRESELFHAVKHVVAAFEGAIHPPVWTKAARCLDHSGEHRGLSEPEVLGSLAEPSVRSGLNSDEVRAVRRAIEILREYPYLVLRALHLYGHHRFLRLPPKGLWVRLDETDGLHRYRRGAGDAAPADYVLEGGPRYAERTDSEVAPIRPVLRGDESLHDPVPRVGRVVWTAIDVAFAERDPHHLPGGVAQNRAAGVYVAAFVRPVSGRPQRGQERGGHAEKERTCLPRTGQAGRNRPPKPP